MFNTFIIMFISATLIGSIIGGDRPNVVSSNTSNTLNSGTSLTYDSSNATTQAATTEF